MENKVDCRSDICICELPDSSRYILYSDEDCVFDDWAEEALNDLKTKGKELSWWKIKKIEKGFKLSIKVEN